MKILIAEDNVDSRIVLQKNLEHAGHVVIVAVNGRDALEKAREHRPDLIVSDILMPEMDGFRLCLEIKRDERLRGKPFVFYTATFVDPEDVRLALSLGASRFILKPVEPERFLVILGEVIKDAREKNLEVPAGPVIAPVELLENYESSLSRKLDEKVRQLEIYKQIFDNSQEALCVLDTAGNVRLANAAHAQIFGFTCEELEGEPVARLLGEEPFAAIRTTLRERGTYEGGMSGRSKAGVPLHLDISAFPIRDERGETTSLVLIFRDASERRLAEAVLRESEDKFKYFFEYSSIGKSLTLPSGETRVNEAFCKMLGYSPEELQGKTWQELTHPDDVDLSQREIEKLLSGEVNAIRFNKRYLKKDGSPVWVDLNASLRRDETGKPLYFMTSLVDITKRMEAEAEILTLNAELEQRVNERTAQLGAANRELEAFSYSVSHDLRSPLRGISAWSRALLEECGGCLDEQARTYVSRVRSEAQRMENLIDDLLNLSRLARTDRHVARVDLSALAAAIASRLQETAAERQVEFVIEPGLVAAGDAHLLEIALTNLLDNAFKFSGKRPRARIVFGQTESEGQRVYFVRDNGAGFDQALAANLFGAFQRLHKTSEYPGTGIGLTIVQRIVHRHGGRIWAEAAVDRGATFSFTLGERS